MATLNAIDPTNMIIPCVRSDCFVEKVDTKSKAIKCYKVLYNKNYTCPNHDATANADERRRRDLQRRRDSTKASKNFPQVAPCIMCNVLDLRTTEKKKPGIYCSDNLGMYMCGNCVSSISQRSMKDESGEDWHKRRKCKGNCIPNDRGTIYLFC